MRRRFPALGPVAAVVAACAAPVAPPPQRSVAVPRAADKPAPPAPASSIAASPKHASCDKPGIFLDPASVDVDVACWPNCARDAGHVAVRIVNCSERSMVFDSFGLAAEGPGFRIDTALSDPIAPGTISPPIDAVVGRTGRGSAVFQLFEVGATDGVGVRVLLPITIRDSLKEAAEAACTARGDFWGQRGMAGTEDCWAVMHDDGKACSDAADCEGQCVKTSEVVVSPTLKRVAGQCSRFKTVFGCRTLIGHTNHGLIPSNVNFPSMCVD